MENKVSVENFTNLDIRVGTIIEATNFLEAKRKAY